MKIIAVLESQAGTIREASRNAVTLAKKIAELNFANDLEICILGDQIEAVAKEASRFAPVIAVQDPCFQKPTSDCFAAAIATVVRERGCDVVVAASTTFGKDCMPRSAAILNGAFVADVIDCELNESKMIWHRTICAGNVIARVAVNDGPVIINALPSAFDGAELGEQEHGVTFLDLDVTGLPQQVRIESECLAKTGRPDVTEASIVVSGGRAFKSADDYERLIGGLADKLGAGTGSSRAAVDAGIAPNENQVGQTGKIIAPDLYLGIGISGAVQHLAGMKNSKVIAVINTDEEAPLLDYADFALIADAYEVIPEMIEVL